MQLDVIRTCVPKMRRDVWRFFMRLVPLQVAPKWAETSAPRGLLRRDVPTLLLVSVPEDDCYVVANLEETDAIADPNSYLGRLLRPYCALLALPYSSNN